MQSSKMDCDSTLSVHSVHLSRTCRNHNKKCKESSSISSYFLFLVFGSSLILSCVRGLELELQFHGKNKLKSAIEKPIVTKAVPRSADHLIVSPTSPSTANLTRKQDGDMVKRHEVTIPVQPRRLFDFITDPSLLITVLHSLEVAYWTFPLGFALSPIINFFRVPNRRSDNGGQIKKRKRSIIGPELTSSYIKLLQSLDAHKRKYSTMR